MCWFSEEFKNKDFCAQKVQNLQSCTLLFVHWHKLQKNPENTAQASMKNIRIAHTNAAETSIQVSDAFSQLLFLTTIFQNPKTALRLTLTEAKMQICKLYAHQSADCFQGEEERSTS